MSLKYWPVVFVAGTCLSAQADPPRHGHAEFFRRDRNRDGILDWREFEASRAQSCRCKSRCECHNHPPHTPAENGHEYPNPEHGHRMLSESIRQAVREAMNDVLRNQGEKLRSIVRSEVRHALEDQTRQKKRERQGEDSFQLQRHREGSRQNRFESRRNLADRHERHPEVEHRGHDRGRNSDRSDHERKWMWTESREERNSARHENQKDNRRPDESGSFEAREHDRDGRKRPQRFRNLGSFDRLDADNDGFISRREFDEARQEASLGKRGDNRQSWNDQADLQPPQAQRGELPEI